MLEIKEIKDLEETDHPVVGECDPDAFRIALISHDNPKGMTAGDIINIINNYEWLKEKANKIVSFDVDAVYLGKDSDTVEVSGTSFYRGVVTNEWESVPIQQFFKSNEDLEKERQEK